LLEVGEAVVMAAEERKGMNNASLHGAVYWPALLKQIFMQWSHVGCLGDLVPADAVGLPDGWKIKKLFAHLLLSPYQPDVCLTGEVCGLRLSNMGR